MEYTTVSNCSKGDNSKYPFPEGVLELMPEASNLVLTFVYR